MKNISESTLSISVFFGLTNRWKEGPILFKDIHAKVVNPYFDDDNYNYFGEELDECITSIFYSCIILCITSRV